MSPDERGAWLIDHTYEQTPEGWVVRADHADSTTTARVEQAITTTEGAIDLLYRPIRDEVLPDRSKERRGQRPSRAAVTAFLIILAIIVVVLGALATDLFGGDDAGPATATTAVPEPDDEATDPTATTAAATDSTATNDVGDRTASDEPFGLTEGPWRFFLTGDESQALYDFQFFEDGTFAEDGAPRNHGTYVLDGAELRMELTRVMTMTPSDGSSDWSEDVTWNETFTMLRIDDAMTGTWTMDDWRYTRDTGLVVSGHETVGTEIFARPERPEDPG